MGTLIALGQLNPLIGAIDSNVSAILKAMKQAKGCQIVVFPEMAITGYMPEDLLFKEGFIDKVMHGLDRIIQASSGISVLVGLPRAVSEKKDKMLANSCAVISDGKLLG